MARNHLLPLLTLSLTPICCLAGSEEASWRLIGPGGGGSTFIPSFSYHNPESFVIRCDMTGNYVTQDGGESYAIFNLAAGAESYAWDPANPNVVYASSVDINRSTDGGKTWKRIFPLPEMIAEEGYRGDHADRYIRLNDKAPAGLEKEVRRIGALRVDPVDPKRVYAGSGKALLWTRDGGKTWQAHELSEPATFIYADAGDLRDQILIMTDSKVYSMSRKSGKLTSKDLPSEMSPAFSFTGGIDPDSKRTRFFAIHSKEADAAVNFTYNSSELWTSADAGKTWKRVDSPVLMNEGGQKPSFTRVATAERDSRYVYIVTDRFLTKNEDGNDAHWFGALRSKDAGKTWEWVYRAGGGSGRYNVEDGRPAPNLSDSWVNEAFGTDYVRLIDVGVAPTDGRVAVVTDWYRAVRTEDGGATWREVYSKTLPNGAVVTRGLDVTTAYAVHFDPFDPKHLAISYTDIGYHHSFDGGQSWKRSVEGIPVRWQNTCYWMAFDPEVEGKLWSVWSGSHDYPRGKMTRSPRWRERSAGGVAVSTNGGRSWTTLLNGIGDGSPSTSIVLDPKSPKEKRTLYVTAYNKGVFKSTDGGESWHLKNNGISEPAHFFQVRQMSDGTLFLVTTPGPIFRDGKATRDYFTGAVYRSKDGAETWERLEVGSKVGFPNDISEDPHKPGRLYLAAWGDLDLSDLIGGAVANATGGNVKLDFDGGVWISEDNGDTWSQAFDPDAFVYAVTADPRHAGRVYAGTFNHAIFQSNDFGKTWEKMPGYDFHWGHRAIPDPKHPENIYFTTFGSSVWYGPHAGE